MAIGTERVRLLVRAGAIMLLLILIPSVFTDMLYGAITGILFLAVALTSFRKGAITEEKKDYFLAFVMLVVFITRLYFKGYVGIGAEAPEPNNFIPPLVSSLGCVLVMEPLLSLFRRRD